MTVGSGGQTDFNQFLKFQSYFLSLSGGRTHSRGRQQRVEGRDCVWIADCGMERTSEVYSSLELAKKNSEQGIRVLDINNFRLKCLCFIQ